MDHMRNSGIESRDLSPKKVVQKGEKWSLKIAETSLSKKGLCTNVINPQNYNFNKFLMLCNTTD